MPDERLLAQRQTAEAVRVHLHDSRFGDAFEQIGPIGCGRWRGGRNHENSLTELSTARPEPVEGRARLRSWFDKLTMSGFACRCSAWPSDVERHRLLMSGDVRRPLPLACDARGERVKPHGFTMDEKRH